MRFHKTLAFSTAFISAAFIGACAIPQPAFECNTLSPFFAFYTLEEGDPASECGSYGGDYLNTQRYLGPQGTDAGLALLPYELAYWSYEDRQNGVEARVDPSDPDRARESAIGRFETLLPDNQGVCKVVGIVPGEQNFPEIQTALEDGGVDITPPLSMRYAWEDVRVLSTAEFQGTMLDGRVTITKDGCTAKYKVYAVHPVVFCALARNEERDGKPYNADCDPNPDPENGRFVGSGMNAAIEPTCITVTGSADHAAEYFGVDFTEVGVCGASPNKTFDALLQ